MIVAAGVEHFRFVPDDEITKEWVGAFALPGADVTIGGRLTFGKFTRLEVFGSLAELSGFEFPGVMSFPLETPLTLPLVYGWCGKDQLSILGLRCDFPMLPDLGVRVERWACDAIVGGLIETDDPELRFRGVRFKHTHLPAWSRATGVESTWFPDERRLQVVVEPTELFAAPMTDEVSVKIHQPALTFDEETGFRIEKPVFFEIRDEPTTWETLLNDRYQPFAALLWFAAGLAGRTEVVELLIREHDEPRRSEWAPLWVSLVTPPPRRQVGLHDLAFSATEFPGAFEEGMRAWLARWTDFEDFLRPLHARAMAPFAYANDRFYTAAAATEAFDKWRQENSRDLSRRDHGERVRRIEAILQKRAPDLVPWAVGVLQNANQIPFRGRVQRLLDDVRTVADALLGTHVELFSEVVEDQRNGHAHAQSRGVVERQGDTLFVLGEVLVTLLRTHLLRELGFAPEDAQARIMATPHFAWLARLARERMSEVANDRSHE